MVELGADTVRPSRMARFGAVLLVAAAGLWRLRYALNRRGHRACRQAREHLARCVKYGRGYFPGRYRLLGRSFRAGQLAHAHARGRSGASVLEKCKMQAITYGRL